MDEYETNYLRFIRENIQYLNEGGVKEEDQAAFIKGIIKDLCLIKDPQIKNNLGLYFEKQNEIDKELERIDAERERIQKWYADIVEKERMNLKNIYEKMLMKI